MPNLNSVMLMGTITRDPEVKYTPKGSAIASFGIAINRSYKVGDGEKREEVTFIDLDAFGKTAELIGTHLRKGRPIFVQGRLKLDQWDDKQSGQKRSKLKVVVDSFEFIGSKEASSEQAQQQPPPQKAPPPQRKPPTDPDLDGDEESIPF